jgi:AraC-like DNA-binding protein
MLDPVDVSSVSPIRPAWIHTIYNASQGAIGAFEFEDARAVASHLIEAIPDPASLLEERLLAGHLLGLAVHWTTRAHRRLHAGAGASCTFQPGVYLFDVWMAHPGPAKSTFRAWCDRYFEALQHAHYDPVAEAARWLRTHYAAPFSIAEVARHAGLHTTTLRRHFQEQFGLTPREYHVRARLLEALRLFVSGRHDARSALHAAGWSSPKCFYRSLLHVSGKSMREVRELDPEAVLRLVVLPLRNGSGRVW